MKGTLHAPFNFCFENIKFLQTTTSAKLGPQEQHSVVAITCVAVVSVSFKPGGVSAREHWAKRSKKIGAEGGGGGGAGKERKRR